MLLQAVDVDFTSWIGCRNRIGTGGDIDLAVGDNGRTEFDADAGLICGIGIATVQFVAQIRRIVGVQRCVGDCQRALQRLALIYGPEDAVAGTVGGDEGRGAPGVLRLLLIEVEGSELL